jgi:8-oxo-dGTP diphosphatase
VTPSVVVCCIIKDGLLLLVRRKIREGTLEWAEPSGKIEPGETPEQAAIREVKEEVGLTVEVTQRLGDRVHPATGRHLIYLACRVAAGEAAILDCKAISQMEWCGLHTAKARQSNLKGGIFPPLLRYMEATMTA